MSQQIIDLPEGEQITEPGFYRISIDRHHGQPCDGPSVTSGVLRRMELMTPADVWAFSLLNPERLPSVDRPALRMGRAMAAYVEGGMEAVTQHFLVLPEDKPRKPTPQQIAAYDEGRATEVGRASVEFWRAVDADPRAPLTDAEMTLIRDMGAALARDPAACAVMGGEPEITMAYRDPITGLWVLSRPDTVHFDGSVTDYKKMATRGEPFSVRTVDRAIERHGYVQQMALACEAFEHLTGHWPDVVSIIAQWDAPPHHVILRPITEECLRIGQFQNRRALDRFAECLRSGHWPGPGEHVAPFQPSEFWWKRAQEDMQMESAG